MNVYVLTFTHAGRLEDVATVAIAVEFGSVELEDAALWLVVERNWNQSNSFRCRQQACFTLRCWITITVGATLQLTTVNLSLDKLAELIIEVAAVRIS